MKRVVEYTDKDGRDRIAILEYDNDFARWAVRKMPQHAMPDKYFEKASDAQAFLDKLEGTDLHQ